MKGIESAASRRLVPYPKTLEPPPGALQLPQRPSRRLLSSGHRLAAWLSSRCTGLRWPPIDRLLYLISFPRKTPFFLLPSSFLLACLRSCYPCGSQLGGTCENPIAFFPARFVSGICRPF
jgi:hypothetical protein